MAGKGHRSTGCATCFLNKASFHALCVFFPCSGSGYEQQDGTGRQERVTREHLPGESLGGDWQPRRALQPEEPPDLLFALGSGHHFPGDAESSSRAAEPAMSVFPSREVPGTSLALHMGKAFGAQRCLEPAAKPSLHGGLYPMVSWACSQLGHISLYLCPPFSSPQGPLCPLSFLIHLPHYTSPHWKK